MKYLDGQYYIEVKDHPYKNRPTESNILKLRDPPKSLRTQYEVQKETQIKKHQKVIRKKGILEVKNYPKKKQSIKQQPKIKPPNCPSCKRNIWLEFDKGYYCLKCEYNINKQKHEIGERIS